MLQLQFIRENTELVRQGLIKRNWKEDQLVLLDQVIALDNERKSLQHQLDNTLAQANALSKEIGDLMKGGQADAAQTAKSKVADLKTVSKELEEQLSQTHQNLEAQLIQIPNIPHASVPAGKGAEDNEVYQDWQSALPDLGSDALPHWDLAAKYNIIDFEAGVKLTGSGFPVYKGQGARLQRALINFFLDKATAAGYLEIEPPLMVNEATARATGQIPDKEAQMYVVERDGFYLIPTAEVPVTNLVRDEILEEQQLPLKFTGYTPCFRREAGAYGKDVRGLNRLHQFDKVEIVQIAHPDKSYDLLQEMLLHVEGLLKSLELPYRILKLCGGDMGFTSALTYDFEVFSAAQQRWLEVSSTSNFETFQSNRLKVRFRENTTRQTRLCHTLNGSALALARIVAALLENHQTPDGIKIPDALRPYTGFDYIR